MPCREGLSGACLTPLRQLKQSMPPSSILLNITEAELSVSVQAESGVYCRTTPFAFSNLCSSFSACCGCT